MFAYSRVSFTQNDYKNNIVDSVFRSPIDPSVLNRVTNADYMYYSTGINVHFKELYNFGSPSGCSYSRFLSVGTSRMATDCFEHCISKMTDWGGNLY
jgi:hypothetical protein